MQVEPIAIPVDPDRSVSGLLTLPEAPIASYVFAHGAGAGMNHTFMAAVAMGLGARSIATLRYQFVYMEEGGKRPDRPPLAHAAVRAAVAAAVGLTPRMPVFAGGKSFGGRMTSQAQAIAPLPGVRGLVFFGFPLHAPKKPSDSRAEHLSKVETPMLFLQGSRDDLADLSLLGPIVDGLGEGASLIVVDGADHSFHVPARLRRSDQEVLNELLDTAAGWMARLAKSERA